MPNFYIKSSQKITFLVYSEISNPLNIILTLFSATLGQISETSLNVSSKIVNLNLFRALTPPLCIGI
jgi:hypothetical protein